MSQELVQRSKIEVEETKMVSRVGYGAEKKGLSVLRTGPNVKDGSGKDKNGTPGRLWCRRVKKEDYLKPRKSLKLF